MPERLPVEETEDTKAVRHFTPREANETLPLVRRIVADIQESGQELMQLAEDLGHQAAEDPRVRKLFNVLNEFMDELNQLGLEYKDPQFRMGLVDFPSVIDGEEVLLCWRSDESNVRFYHAPDGGYAGRKPIPEEYLGTSTGPGTR